MKAMTLALVLVISAATEILWIEHPRGHIAAPSTEFSADSVEKAPKVCVSYPHALAKCGVASPADFEALREDPTLRLHYSDVGMVQPAALTADEWDFASFRGDSGIVWTPTRILVRAGELVFRDRSGNMIRARCGNRLSHEVRAPAAFVMPPEMEHETPEIAFVEPPLLVGWPGKPDDFLVPPFSPDPPSMGPSPTPFGLPFSGPAAPPPLPPVLPPIIIPPPFPVIGRINDTPEPDTYLLLLAGISGLLILEERDQL
jgi:hypothetical protein